MPEVKEGLEAGLYSRCCGRSWPLLEDRACAEYEDDEDEDETIEITPRAVELLVIDVERDRVE